MSWASIGSIAMAPRSCSSPKMRAMRSVCGASPMLLPTSRMRSTSTSSRDNSEAVNPAKTGTKAAAHYVLDVPAGGSQTVRLRLAAAETKNAFGGFDKTFKSRIADADEFYDRIAPNALNEDRAPGAPPGAGGTALEQAVLLLRPGAVAARAQEPSAARIRPPRRAQHRVVPHAQRRRDLHAGQVGVSVVCGLGPGLPYDRPVAGGF